MEFFLVIGPELTDIMIGIDRLVDELEHEAVYPIDQRFQQEAGKLAGGSRIAFRALQSSAGP